MRQTSQAVLLLLGAASAGVVDPKFKLSTQAAGTPALSITNQATSAQLTGILNPVYTPAVALPTVVVAAAAAGVTKADTAGSTSCVDCVRSVSVWCSAGWNYEYVGLPLATAYPDPKTAAAAMTWDNTGDANSSKISVPLTSGDLGACCYTTADAKTEFVKNILDTSSVPQLDTVKFNKYTCPAKLTGDPTAKANYAAGTTTAQKATQMLHSANNWWCSDGSYNLADVSDDTYSTGGADPSSNMKDPAAWGTSADVYTTGKLLDVSANPLTQDKRLELFLAACRQKRLICGASHVPEAVAAGETMKRTIVKTASGFSTSEKCTWTLRSKTKAPTFAISQATKDKQLPSNYDVVYQEWVEGWQLDKGEFLTGYNKDGTTANTQGGIPLPSMAAVNYGSVYKYNYEGTAVAGTNNAQVPGEAFTYHRTSAACATDASNLSTGANTPTANCWLNNMEKRWFSLDPSGAQYQNRLAADYASKLTAYNADATKYNAYLAKVKENAEVDAFAAFFSPPEKPALVKRPAAPTKPAAYTGMAHWSVAKQQNWRMLKGGAAGDPTPGTEYILGNNKMGGWGSWTISRLVGGYQTAEANKISHSFGMLGTTQSATLDTGRSYLKNWQKTVGLDTTTAPGTTGARVATQYVGKSTAGNWAGTETGSVMCGAVVTTATHACGWKTGATKSAANAKWVYLNISVWANGSAAQTAAQWTTAAVDMEIQFYASAWADGTDYYSPAAAATGTTLTEPAAAQALAASAAAALAVAAALY